MTRKWSSKHLGHNVTSLLGPDFSSNMASKLETTMCEHQAKKESLQDIIDHLLWKIGQLEIDLDDVQYELSFWPEYVGKWAGHEALSEEKCQAEKEVTICSQMIQDQREEAKAEKCTVCLL